MPVNNSHPEKTTDIQSECFVYQKAQDSATTPSSPFMANLDVHTAVLWLIA